MSIVTFYSYKGGVGRTMAMANVATVLAQRGHKVLVVDWDLEAPGLEEYFEGFHISPKGRGLLQLLWDVTKGNEVDYRKHLWELKSIMEDTSLMLLPSGREEETYYPMLERFSQDDFFSAGGGDYLERLRERWLRDFDFVLIDSRTGLSDAGGICTIQLPDIVVALFTATRQSLYGVRDVMRLALDGRQRFEYDRMHLSVIPVPSRMDIHDNPNEADFWLETFAQALEEYFEDWLPTSVSPYEVLKKLTIPHDALLLHGASLTVHPVTISVSNTVDCYKNLAAFVESDLSDIRALGFEVATVNVETDKGKGIKEDYEYDIFISSRRGSIISTWIRDSLLPVLSNWLSEEIGRPARIFFDESELSAGGRYPEALAYALGKSRLLLPVFSSSYFRSQWSLSEYHTFQKREEELAKSEREVPYHNLIFPVVFSNGAHFPEYARARQWLDLKRFAATAKAFRESKRFLEFEETIREFSSQLGKEVNNAPEYSPDWPRVSPSEVHIETDFDNDLSRPKL